MEVSTLEDFIYNQDFNIPMKITYKNDDDNNDLEKSIFEHYLIKPYLRSTDNPGEVWEEEEGFINPYEGIGYFVLHRWPPENPEDMKSNEPYYICEVVRVLNRNRVVLRKLKPFLMLSLVYENADGREYRLYKYYKGVYDDEVKTRIIDDFFSVYSKFTFKNINEFIIFRPNWTDY